ncbi:hypothetical protein N7478_002205 [Penicillium angulare]|uniref:uncharacterized protein n=1 Tax=Penicillium angulare TaxID=116970 RepID=UPI002541F0C7|nr:uncharacterized protein N7478_002205 [Penicillium angulare]KAJ5289175.1 hypothetical protein N7478_002205 [Penicillium angulare]
MCSFDPVPLTPLDQTLPSTTTVSFLLFFQPEDINSALQVARSGWEQLVHRLPLLAGNVANQSVEGQKKERRFIVPANCPPTVDELVEIRYQPLKLADIDSREAEGRLVASLRSSEAQAVSRVVLNVMKNGIVFCLTWSHGVFDGNGASLLVEMLADICQGNVSHSKTSHTIEVKLRKMISNLHRPSQDCLRDFSDLLTSGEEEEENLDPERSLVNHSFPLSSARLYLLRESCDTFLRQWSSLNQEKSPPSLTTNDILTSAVALCVTRSRNKGTQAPQVLTTVDFGMSVDVRKHLGISTGDGQQYLGNTFVTIAVHADLPPTQKDSGRNRHQLGNGIEMTDFSLITYLASQVRHKLSAINRAHVSSLVSYLRETIANRQVFFETWGMTFSSVRHLPLHSLDFGGKLGRVRDFKDYKSDSDGSVYVQAKRPDFSQKVGEGQVQLLITLNTVDMNIFMKDPLIAWLQGLPRNSRL